MSTTASRRGLLGALAALLFAAVPVAMAAATAGNPDAELIAACAEYDQCHWDCERIYDESKDEDAPRDLLDPIEEREEAIIERIEALRAATPWGIVARARTLATVNSTGDREMDPGSTGNVSRMMKALMRDALAISGLPVPPVLLEGAPDEMTGEAAGA